MSGWKRSKEKSPNLADATTQQDAYSTDHSIRWRDVFAGIIDPSRRALTAWWAYPKFSWLMGHSLIDRSNY